MKTMSKKQLDIILAATSEFEMRGFSGTSMEKIAAAAGVSKRTLYKYYGSKEVVFSAIIKHLQQSTSLEQCPQYLSEKPLREQLVEVIHAMLMHLNEEEHIRLARIVISEVVRKPELSDILSDTVDFTSNAPFQWICSAINDGSLRQVEPTKALTHLTGLVKSIGLWSRLIFCAPALNEEEMRTFSEEYADFFLSYYQI
ncbi:TetR family transcriptional regulator [Pseudodesulfovibrio nedwellii]|uniref:TetR family transcriptional regulator n=2 Tax=Pseudodesulfovibrio nedwellii TaxID=2973072 RepID=A0ABM8B0H2_9BACT|nr:TetR family transcriptional regulator [Pseudodesulfovibrio nedwellii]